MAGEGEHPSLSIVAGVDPLPRMARRMNEQDRMVLIAAGVRARRGV
jgi:hypothetical protein